MNKKTILVFIDWFLPGTNAGGPIRSVYSLVKLLKDDYHFKIFTRNTDHNSITPYPNIKADCWVHFDEGVDVYYCSESNLTKQTIKAVLDSVDFDKIYINSLYSKWFSIIPLKLVKNKKALNRVVLAPRGMLGKGALSIKPFKKKLFLFYAKVTGLHKHIIWQASSENEQKDIFSVFGVQASIKIAGNLAYIEQLPFVERKKEIDEIRVFFLSRIVPIKNLHLALQALLSIGPDQKVQYDIYGPLEDMDYWKKCQEIIATLPGYVKVTYKGIIPNEKTQTILKEYHALLMPTLNENFGHSILESFAAGCLVVISDQTPWNNLQSMNVGYNIPVGSIDAEKQLCEALDALLLLNQDVFNTYGLKAWTFAHFYLANNANLKANKQLFA